MNCTRSYKLKIFGNPKKVDTARYTQMRFIQYCNTFSSKVYFGDKKISTVGMGITANQALYKVFGAVRALKASGRVLKKKTNVPFFKRTGCRANIEKSKSSCFDYWIMVSNQWSKTTVRLPAKSHKALNKALRDGWEMSSLCEFKMINGNAYAVVFVSKEVEKASKPNRFFGCDVGYKYSVCRSDGHIGQNISKVIRRSKQIQAERRRQKHKISNKTKTAVKQVLDMEAKKAIGRSKRLSARLVVESPKVMARLSTGRLHGWARTYFANRLETLGKENGIQVLAVNPYQTSIACFRCKSVDKQSRDGQAFKCTSCGHADHADVNAAKNIAVRASEKSERINFLGLGEL